MNLRAIIASCSLLLCFVNTAFAIDGVQNSEMEFFLQKAAKTYSIPGLSVCVVDGGGIVYSFNSGTDNGELITSDSDFYLGSTSKTFTALAVMRLVEQGKVELDTPVKKYLPDFEIQNKEYESQITVRHLLNHRSGLSGKGMEVSPMGLESLEEELKALSNCNPDHAPGSHYEYFNSNYRVLGLLIERVSGVSFADFIADEIFRPLNMTRTTAGQADGIAPVEGHGQLLGFTTGRKQVYPKGAVPSGYMVSTANDVARFMVAEIRAGRGDSALLSRETVRQTWKPSDTVADSYAMGWLAVRDSLDNKFYVHGGSLVGYQSFFYLNPDKSIGFVVLMNQGGLFPSMGLNVVRNGLIFIINNQSPSVGVGKIPVVIAATMLLLVAAFYVFRIIRIWRRPRFGVLRKITFYSDIAVSIFIAVGLVPLMNRIMGERADWKMLWDLLPEFCLLLAIICVGNLVCAGVKIKQELNLTIKYV